MDQRNSGSNPSHGLGGPKLVKPIVHTHVGTGLQEHRGGGGKYREGAGARGAVRRGEGCYKALGKGGFLLDHDVFGNDPNQYGAIGLRGSLSHRLTDGPTQLAE